MGGGFGPSAQQAAPIGSLDAAKQAFQVYVEKTGNPNLSLDGVMKFQWNYYAIVKEKSTGMGAFELLADPGTGAVFPEMGPNMMRNNEVQPHGHLRRRNDGRLCARRMMSGTWGPTAPVAQPTVTTDQAQQIAQQWLDQYQVSSATELPDSFAGYSTFHITKDGQLRACCQPMLHGPGLVPHLAWCVHCLGRGRSPCTIQSRLRRGDLSIQLNLQGNSFTRVWRRSRSNLRRHRSDGDLHGILRVVVLGAAKTRRSASIRNEVLLQLNQQHCRPAPNAASHVQLEHADRKHRQMCHEVWPSSPGGDGMSTVTNSGPMPRMAAARTVTAVPPMPSIPPLCASNSVSAPLAWSIMTSRISPR
jgi:hypothetical protein